MAKKKESTRVKEALSTSQHDAEGELTSLWQNIQEKPWMYGLGTTVVIAAILFTIGYQQYSKSANRETYTTYAKALEAEGPAEQAEELESAASTNPAAPEILYMMGESAIKAGEYDKAKSALERLRQEHPESRFVPDAVEALGFIAQENEDFEAALKAYNEITEKWPLSFAARRQPLNIARVYQAQGNLEAAIEAYRDQSEQFPDSSVAKEAEAALAELRESNPDLFPEPVSEETPPEGEAATEAEISETPGDTPSAESRDDAKAEEEELPDVSAAPELTIPEPAETEPGDGSEKQSDSEQGAPAETQPDPAQ